MPARGLVIMTGGTTGEFGVIRLGRLPIKDGVAVGALPAGVPTRGVVAVFAVVLPTVIEILDIPI